MDAEIGRLLGDPNHDRWSLDTLHTREEEAQSVIQALTGAVRTIETLTPTLDTKEVTVNANTIDIVRATITDTDGNVWPLEGRSIADLDYYVPNWQNNDSGQPVNISYDASNHQVILTPKPNSSFVVTDGLKIWEVRIPTAMTDDTSEPFEANAAMQAYANSINHWVTAQCWMDDGTPEALSKARFHKSGSLENPGEFEKYIRLINSKFNAPSIIPERIKWSPQGGRLGGTRPSKSFPFA